LIVVTIFADESAALLIVDQDQRIRCAQGHPIGWGRRAQENHEAPL